MRKATKTTQIGLTKEGPEPEWPQGHIDDGACDVDEPVRQERSNAKEDDVEQQVVSLLLNLMARENIILTIMLNEEKINIYMKTYKIYFCMKLNSTNKSIPTSTHLLLPCLGTLRHIFQNNGSAHQVRKQVAEGCSSGWAEADQQQGNLPPEQESYS